MKLVLLPGLDGTGDLFEPLIAALDPALEPVVVRYPHDDALGYAQLVALAQTCLPENDAFAILGESFSGPVAISLAASRPHGLRCLILCCTFARNPHPTMWALKSLLHAFPLQHAPSAMTRFALLGSNADRELEPELVRVLSTVRPIVLKKRLAEVLSVDVTGKLADISVPSLYLRAAHDHIVPRAAGDLIGKRMTDVRIVEFDVPHFLLQVAPERAAQVIREFIDRRSEESPGHGP